MEKKENLYAISAPLEYLEGDIQDKANWGRGDHLPGGQVHPESLVKSLQLVAITMSDTDTLLAASPDFQNLKDSSVFCRPDFGSALIFETHLIIRAVTGAAPTASVLMEFQTWLNQYHVLISPSGFANDWAVELPAIGANQAWEFNQTFIGTIFNVEFRKAPDYHLIEFKYRVQTIPAGWTSITVIPRMTLVSAIPSSNISFVRV